MKSFKINISISGFCLVLIILLTGFIFTTWIISAPRAQAAPGTCNDGKTTLPPYSGANVNAEFDKYCKDKGAGGYTVTAATASAPGCDPDTGLPTGGASVICPVSECAVRDSTGKCDKTAVCDLRTEKYDRNNSCGLISYINLAISFMAVMTGIVITILIIVGGIQYTMAGSDPNNVAKAKSRIGNAIGALVGFGLLFAIVQYLVPGGIF